MNFGERIIFLIYKNPISKSSTSVNLPFLRLVVLRILAWVIPQSKEDIEDIS